MERLLVNQASGKTASMIWGSVGLWQLCAGAGNEILIAGAWNGWPILMTERSILGGLADGDGAVFGSALCDVLQMDEKTLSLTGSTAWQVMRGLADARRLILSLQVTEGLSRIEQIEPVLGDLPHDVAKKMEFAFRLCRAIGFALQDDIRPALHFAQSALRQVDEYADNCAAKTVCRLVYWKLGDLDNFFALPRNRLRSTTNGREAVCDVFDLTIEAAVEFNQLRLASARHLAQDALGLAARISPGRPALTALPASLLAQLLYEQGSLDEAEQMIVCHLPAIRAGGAIESALLAYPILARAAFRRGRHAHAMTILEDAEKLAQQRGWRRLAAAGMAERASLLLENDQIAEASACVDALEHLATSPDAGPGNACSDIHPIWTLARARVALVQCPSRSTVAMLRQLQHEAVNRQDLYEALQLAVRLVDAFEVIGERPEALAVLLKTLTLGSAIGVYQAFLDGGDRVQKLLTHIYSCPPPSDVRLRGLLPYIGSLLGRYRACEFVSSLSPPQSGTACVLSEREQATLVWMSRGLSNKGIAKKLGVTPETIKSHAKKIFMKLTVKTRAEAVSRASGLGLI